MSLLPTKWCRRNVKETIWREIDCQALPHVPFGNIPCGALLYQWSLSIVNTLTYFCRRIGFITGPVTRTLVMFVVMPNENPCMAPLYEGLNRNDLPFIPLTLVILLLSLSNAERATFSLFHVPSLRFFHISLLPPLFSLMPPLLFPPTTPHHPSLLPGTSPPISHNTKTVFCVA